MSDQPPRAPRAPRTVVTLAVRDDGSWTVHLTRDHDAGASAAAVEGMEQAAAYVRSALNLTSPDLLERVAPEEPAKPQPPEVLIHPQTEVVGAKPEQPPAKPRTAKKAAAAPPEATLLDAPQAAAGGQESPPAPAPAAPGLKPTDKDKAIAQRERGMARATAAAIAVANGPRERDPLRPESMRTPKNDDEARDLLHKLVQAHADKEGNAGAQHAWAATMRKGWNVAGMIDLNIPQLRELLDDVAPAPEEGSTA